MAGLMRKNKSGKKGFKKKDEFDQKMIDISRVARVVKGGRRFRFRALVVVGNRRGKVGCGLAKGLDVTSAIQKAVNQAKKSLITIDVKKNSVPYPLDCKYKGARIRIKPAAAGRGIIAGSSVRAVCELAGLRDISVKIIGSRNRISNARAIMDALKLIYKQ
jgi:small subunit ribosomal protein S5